MIRLAIASSSSNNGHIYYENDNEYDNNGFTITKYKIQIFQFWTEMCGKGRWENVLFR